MIEIVFIAGFVSGVLFGWLVLGKNVFGNGCPPHAWVLHEVWDNNGPVKYCVKCGQAVRVDVKDAKED